MVTAHLTYAALELIIIWVTAVIRCYGSARTMTDPELLATLEFVELSDFVTREGGLHEVVPAEDWAGKKLRCLGWALSFQPVPCKVLASTFATLLLGCRAGFVHQYMSLILELALDIEFTN
jgi:hypothetical protein